jgi:amino acid transporter
MGELHRVDGGKLGLKELLAIGVGGMIGGGIFSVLGISVSFAGNGAPLSFLIDMLIALAAGYHYVKLSLTFRDDGASYTYLRKAFPTRPWIAGVEGWTVIFGYIGTLALYAYTFGAYGAELLGAPHSFLLRSVLSISVLSFFLFINLRGVRTSGVTEDIIVYGKIIILLLFAVIGLSQVNPQRFHPFCEKGISPVFLGAAVIFVAYEGFQLITNAILETENPDRNIPLGIYGSILVTGAIYILLSIVAVGTLSYGEIVSAKEYALAKVAEPLLGNLGKVLVGVGALMATSSAINSTLFGASRMMAEMAEEKMMPSIFSRRNVKGVPFVSLLFLTLLATVFTSLGTLSVIAEFSSLTFLLVSVGVSIANIRLRRETSPDLTVACLGLILMLVTAGSILIYLLTTNPAEVAVILFLYLLLSSLAVSYILLSRN